MNVSYVTTETRRKYPKDREGPKNEWKALIKQQTEINNQIVLFEKEVSNLRARQLGQAYDQQLQEQIEEKEYQLRLKQKDAEIMNLKIKQFEMEELQGKLDKHTLQRMQADHYESKIKEIQFNNAEERRRNIEYEIAQMMENKEKMETEKQARTQKKQEMKGFFNGQLEEFHHKKNQEKLDYKQFREDYLQQMHEKNQRDMIKEENYRNFYRMTAEDQNQKAQIHKEKVLSDQHRREQHILDSIDRGVEEVHRRNEEKFRFEKAMREESKQNLLKTLDLQVNAKKQKQSFEHQEKQNIILEGQQKRDEYQKYLGDIAKEKRIQQQSYKNLLDKQHQDLEEINRTNRMNRAEKRINIDDLQAYKITQPTIHALIPGMVHTKHDFHGSPALKPLLNMNHSDTQRSITNIYKPAGISGPTHSPQKLANVASTKGLSAGHDPTLQPHLASSNVYANEKGQQQQTQESSRGSLNPQLYNLNKQSPPSLGIEEKKATLAEIHSLSTKAGHNPIYNPVPFNIQNPYILKQLQNANRNKVIQQQNYLANIASNNLANPSNS